MPKQKNQTPVPKLTDYFKPEEIGRLDGDYTGRTLLLNPAVVKAEFRSRENLIWKAHGGFGCDPSKIGRAVFAQFLADKESARWDRHDFLAEYIPLDKGTKSC